MPAASGASGPMTVRPTRFSFAKAISRENRPAEWARSWRRPPCRHCPGRRTPRPRGWTVQVSRRGRVRAPTAAHNQNVHENDPSHPETLARPPWPRALCNSRTDRREAKASWRGPVRAAVWKMAACCRRNCGRGNTDERKVRTLLREPPGHSWRWGETLRQKKGYRCTKLWDSAERPRVARMHGGNLLHKNHGPCGPPLFHRYHLARRMGPRFRLLAGTAGGEETGSSPREMQVRVVDKVLVAVKNLVAVAS